MICLLRTFPYQSQDTTGIQEWSRKQHVPMSNHSVSKPGHHWHPGLVPKTPFTDVKAFRIRAGTPLGYRSGPKSTIFLPCTYDKPCRIRAETPLGYRTGPKSTMCLCQPIRYLSWDTTGIQDWSQKHHAPMSNYSVPKLGQHRDTGLVPKAPFTYFKAFRV